MPLAFDKIKDLLFYLFRFFAHNKSTIFLANIGHFDVILDEKTKNNGRYNFFKRIAKNAKTGEKRQKTSNIGCFNQFLYVFSPKSMNLLLLKLMPCR
jgi:hypothetical protein